jgi:hypothetical protein
MSALVNTYDKLLVAHTYCLFIDSSETPELHIWVQHGYYVQHVDIMYTCKP